ncbi:MAG: exodeoxyribonuclease VII large subunit, partial [Synergistaceae bacterium]|nr:exodeoxyribonuclease VII large subunit [Synergistaceae bacterium]
MATRRMQRSPALPLFSDDANPRPGEAGFKPPAAAGTPFQKGTSTPRIPFKKESANAPIEVDQLTERIQNLFDSDEFLKSVIITGEIREAKLHTSGHYYFALLGENSRITCALFRQHSGHVP